MPRILILTESFYPPSVGGLEKHIYYVAKTLVAKGLNVSVITRQTIPLSANFEWIDGVAVRRITPKGNLRGKGLKALFPIMFFLLKILYMLFVNAGRYNIVMVYGFKLLPLPVVLMSLFFRKKCIIRASSPIDFWEGISSESLEKMKLPLSVFLLRLWGYIRNSLIRQADSFVAISSEMRKELIGIGVDPKKIKDIPQGTETDTFCPVSSKEKLLLRDKLSIQREKIIINFTGRLAASKGLIPLIKAFQKLLRENKDIHLLVVGSGLESFDDCEDEMKEYVRSHKIEGYVTFAGEVGNVADYLKASDIFVFPSEYEGFGYSIIEAMSCGLPTIVTRVGVANEIIRDYRNGILINTKDIKEIEEAIKGLLDNRDTWASIGREARESIIEEYSAEVEYEKYYEMCL